MTLSITHPLGKLVLQAAREDGWNVTNPGEAEVARHLAALGYTLRDVETQFNLGPYKLDFAIPSERIDIEADGWVHGTRQVRRRDSERDRRVRGWGWTVIRLDLERGDVAGQLRRHVPGRTRIAGYGDTLRQVDFIFKAYLDRLQAQGVSSPEEHLGQMRDALRTAYESMPRGHRAGPAS